MNHKIWLATLCSCAALLLFQCKKSEEPFVVPEIPEPPPPSLVGFWKENNPGDGFFAGDSYTIQLFADSTFQLSFKMWSDGVTHGQCPNNRTDHARGKFWSKNGYLRFTGKYCTADFTADQPRCDSIFSYNRFSTLKLSAQTLVLAPAGSESSSRKLTRQ